MKKIFGGLLLALMTTTLGFAAELDLRDITNNVYRGKGTEVVTPLQDGKHYIAINATKQSNAVTMENTATTRVSDHPHNSK